MSLLTCLYEDGLVSFLCENVRENVQMAIKSITEIKMWKPFEHQRRLKKKQDSHICAISDCPLTIFTNDHLESATPAANLFQGCQTNLKDGLAENNRVVIGAEIQLPTTQ